MIHVITPTIPGRAELLTEAMASVQDQWIGGERLTTIRHHVGVDLERRGPATIRNELARLAGDGDWLAFLDDDDIWYPNHLAALLRALTALPADVVYSLADVLGRPGWDPQQDSFDAARMRRANYIPLCGVLFRASLFHQVGGFAEHDVLYEDHHLFLRLLDAGASFTCVPERTWAYRFGDWDCRSREIWDGRRGKPKARR